MLNQERNHYCTLRVAPLLLSRYFPSYSRRTINKSHPSRIAKIITALVQIANITADPIVPPIILVPLA
jgi:hypothetical protein